MAGSCHDGAHRPRALETSPACALRGGVPAPGTPRRDRSGRALAHDRGRRPAEQPRAEAGFPQSAPVGVAPRHQASVRSTDLLVVPLESREQLLRGGARHGRGDSAGRDRCIRARFGGVLVTDLRRGPLPERRAGGSDPRLALGVPGKEGVSPRGAKHPGTRSRAGSGGRGPAYPGVAR